MLLLYTDCITEAWEKGSVRNERDQDQMFGEDRLQDVLKNNGHLPTEEIKDAILKSHKAFVSANDVTFVILKKLIYIIKKVYDTPLKEKAKS